MGFKQTFESNDTRLEGRLSTIVSIVPFPIMEFKPGLFPGQFDIKASTKEEPEVLVIGTSQFYVEVDEDRTVTVRVPSDDVAKAVVKDYIISNLAFDPDKESMPGLFYLPGECTSEEVKTLHSDILNKYKRFQRNWFLELVKMADDDWERTAQHKTISEMQRYAAKSLKLERPWIIVPQVQGDTFQKCISCASLLAIEAIVCPNCRCILDKKRYDALQFANQ